MKHLLATMCLVFACSVLSSQTKQGSWEFSLSGNLGSTSSRTETTTPSGTTTTESEAQGFLSLALRPGYYVIDGLVVEPEILWTTLENIPPSFSLSVNVAYNFRIPESQVTPFVLAGYGTGNAVPIFQRLFFRSSDKLDIGVLNLGGGVKIFFAEQIALRAEYRYQRFSQERTSSFGSSSYTTERTQNFHNVFFGFSFFVP
jgi:opacity protein-like surface antigen